MSKIANITGVILAGGRSSRFGTNKALAPFRGEPMVQRVARVMASLFDDVLLVTNAPEAYSSLGLRTVADEIPDKGPLGGLVTALQNTLNDRVFVVACDMPVLEADIVRSVVSASEGFDAAIATHDGVREYLLALYSRRLLARLRCCLEEGRLSLRDFCAHLSNVAAVPVDGDAWFNVNTRKDLEFLETHHADGRL